MCEIGCYFCFTGFHAGFMVLSSLILQHLLAVVVVFPLHGAAVPYCMFGCVSAYVSTYVSTYVSLSWWRAVSLDLEVTTYVVGLWW